MPMDKRHGKISPRQSGRYGRQELALYGTTCDDVQAIVRTLAAAMLPMRSVLIDADHSDKSETDPFDRWQSDSAGGVAFTQHGALDRLPTQSALFGYDCIFVNGNHHAAQQQIVICREEKSNSLRKRAAELTDVIAIVLNAEGELTDTVRELIPHSDSLPQFHPTALNELASWIHQDVLTPPPIHGLILTGGKSSRMGRDKALLTYHQEPQFLHLNGLLKSLNIRPFISCRPEQASFFEDHGLEVITDRIYDIGPSGGILSAMMQHPDHAWLVLACDVPGIDAETINELIQQRSQESIATAFAGALQGFPEPLIAIWEPKSMLPMLQSIGLGYSCPRKVLIQFGAKTIRAKHPEKLDNINTPDEAADYLEESGNN